MSIQAVSGISTVDWSAIKEAQSSAGSTAAGQAAPPIGGGGAPPAGSGGKASSSSETESSSSSSAQIYDPRDSNKDGVVSYEEAMMYSIQHPEMAEEESTTRSTPLQAGLNAYKQGAQTGGTTGSVSAVG
jgi:hypothetical protein